MRNNRGQAERAKSGVLSRRHGDRRWCRLQVECLEGRLLLSGSSLSGAPDFGSNRLSVELGAVAGLQQPSPASVETR